MAWCAPGISCEYYSLASIIEFHGGGGPAKEGSSDLYCISVLQPLGDDSELTIVPQAGEIAACEWRPVEDVLAHPFYAPSTAFGVSFRSAWAVATTMQSTRRRRLSNKEEVEESQGKSESESESESEGGSGRDGSIQGIIDTESAGLSAASFPLGRGRSRASVLYSQYTT